MRYSQSAGAILIGADNRVAVVSQHGTSWSLLKGTLEEGESKLTALKRELMEEAGITEFKLVKELGIYDRYLIGKNGGEDKSHHKTITIFLCTTGQRNLEPRDPENPEARWIDIQKVAELLTHPEDQRFYNQVLPQIEHFIASRNK